MVRRVHFLIQGTVQGVNFRYHTQKVAREHNLTGWIRNIPSDKVNGEVQGEEKGVEALLEYVKEGPKNARVGKVQTEEQAVVEGEEDFEVRQGKRLQDAGGGSGLGGSVLGGTGLAAGRGL